MTQDKDLERDCWQLQYDCDMQLNRYKVEVYPTTVDYWRSKPLMLNLTAFDYPENDVNAVSHHNLEVILHRMFPKLFEISVKSVKPVLNARW